MSSRSLRPRGRKIGVAALTASLGLAGLGLVAPPVAADTIDTVSDNCGRLAGASRYGTAGAIADAYDAESPTDTAIIASGLNFPDALAASGLSRELNAPILLTDPDSVPLETRAALEDLGVTNVVIVGGTAAVSAAVAADLDDDYAVDRVAGDDRYETARDIAVDEIQQAGELNGLRTAVIATGLNYPDALAGGPIAYHGDGTNPFPLLLVAGGTIPADTTEALEALDIEQVIILGGTAAVPATVETALEAQTGNDAIRLAGANREGTAQDVAEFAVEELGFAPEAVLLADGYRRFPSPDALTGGPLGGLEMAPILLVNNPNAFLLPAATEAFITANAAAIEQVIALGGTAAVDTATLEAACEAGGVPVGDGDVTLNSRSVQQGGTLTGTVTGNNISSVTVSGCGLTNQTIADDNATSADDRNFTLTIPANQPAGECTLTFTITDDDGTRTETERITVTPRATAASTNTRPELVAADIVSTTPSTGANPGTVIRYTFDEPVTGPIQSALFHVYTFAGAPEAAAGTATLDPADTRSVLVNFAGITTTAAASQLSVATVDIGAVTDAQGQQNPEGDDAVGAGGTQTLVQGTTSAPDLRSVGGFGTAQDDPATLANESTASNVVTFTFDQNAVTVTPTGFHLVLTDGNVVNCTGPAPGNTTAPGQAVAGGNGTTTITVVCDRATTGTFAGQALTAANVARGYVDQNTVASTAAAGSVPNPTEASDSPDVATPTPDLVSAQLRPGASAAQTDSVLYTFDEAVVDNAGTFGIYDSNGNETLSTDITCSGQVCEAVFGPGTQVESTVGAFVLPNAVFGSSTTDLNRTDEVGVANTLATTTTPGRTSGPDLTAVEMTVTGRSNLTNEVTSYAAVYTFDEPLAAVTTPNDFHLVTSDGRLLIATVCTLGTTANSGTSTVRCTEYNTATVVAPNSTTPTGDVTTNTLALSAVLGTVNDTAVTAVDGAPSNPEGAEATTGGTGTRTA